MRILQTLALAAMVLPTFPGHAVQVDEYELKTAYLYNFALFVTWPDTWLPDYHNTIGICTIGDDQLGTAIDKLHARKLREKKMVVRRSIDLKQAASCHMLYIAESERQNITSIIESLRGANVLTITDAPVKRPLQEGNAMDIAGSDAASPSIITLIHENNKLKFDVNTDAANKAGLTISSRLLYLARHVY